MYLRRDLDAALGAVVAALRGLWSAGADLGISLALDRAALIAIQRADLARAVRLGAFADRLRRDAGGGTSMAIINVEPPLAQARRAMDSSDFDRAVAEGEAFDLDRAVAEALAVNPGA